MTSTADDHPHQCIQLNALGRALRSRFEEHGALADLDEAIDVQRRAVTSAATEHPSHPSYLANLANCLRLRHQRTRNGKDLNEGIDVARRAVSTVSVDNFELEVVPYGV
ncbi:hypothetical protein [Streptomyces chartreusis]